MIDSKVIETELETEIFIDQISNIELTKFHTPNHTFPFYEVMVGIEMIRLRDNECYGTKQAYFGVRIAEDLQSELVVYEPEQQSIFAVKNKEEKKAAAELVDYVLVESPSFKELVQTMINDIKQANVVSGTEIKDLKAKIDLLERLLNIGFEDVKFAIPKKEIA